MPPVNLRYKTGKGLSVIAGELARALPEIIAPQLDIAPQNDGGGPVKPKQVYVTVDEGSKADVNTKDIIITICAHDYKERLCNSEECKNEITDGINSFLKKKGRKVSVIILTHLFSMEVGVIGEM